MSRLAKRTKGVYPPLLEGMRSLGRDQRAGIAQTHRPPTVKTAAGSDFPLELVDLATPSSSPGQEGALSKTNAISTTVVLASVRKPPSASQPAVASGLRLASALRQPPARDVSSGRPGDRSSQTNGWGPSVSMRPGLGEFADDAGPRFARPKPAVKQ